jgi:L-asparaginase II
MKARVAMRNAKPLAGSFEPIESPSRAAVVVTRGGIVESQHAIRYAIADPSGAIVESAGDIDAPTFLRSSAKPLICATVVQSGAADRFGFTDVELAVASGSHSGEPYHIEAVRGMLAKAGIDESALQCGPHPPSHEPSAAALAAAGERPRSIHNNCSGKHAAILALAVHLGAPTSDYLSASNAAEAKILASCAELFGVERSSMAVGVDGCGIPVVAVPLRNSAQLYARIADTTALPAHWREAIERVRRAMVNNPAYVAGTGRFDTDLMRATFPNVASKGGAEGFHASASIARKIGMCVKVADGNYRAIPPFVIERLHERGVLDDEAVKLLATHRRPAVKNHAGAIVGEIRAV